MREPARRPRPLTPIQKIAASLLASGASDAQAAANCGVAVTTIRLWRKRPDFQEEVNARVDEFGKAIQRSARSLMPKALSTLNSILDDPDATRGERTAASRVAMDRVPLGRISVYEGVSEGVPGVEHLVVSPGPPVDALPGQRKISADVEHAELLHIMAMKSRLELEAAVGVVIRAGGELTAEDIAQPVEELRLIGQRLEALFVGPDEGDDAPELTDAPELPGPRVISGELDEDDE